MWTLLHEMRSCLMSSTATKSVQFILGKKRKKYLLKQSKLQIWFQRIKIWNKTYSKYWPECTQLSSWLFSPEHQTRRVGGSFQNYFCSLLGQSWINWTNTHSWQASLGLLAWHLRSLSPIKRSSIRENQAWQLNYTVFYPYGTLSKGDK